MNLALPTCLANNPMPTKSETDAAYYQQNKARIKARANAYYHRNAEEQLAKQKLRYAANKTAVTARNRQWADEHRDKMRAYHAAYVSRNTDLWRAQTARYRARKRKACPAWANAFFIREAYALMHMRKRICGGEWHVDHIVPLTSELVCGLHVEYNLRVIPGKANRSKSNKYWPDMPT